MMRTFDQKIRVGGETLKEIRAAVGREAIRLRDLEVQTTDRPLLPAHVVNLVLMYYFGLDEELRTRIAQATATRYQEHRESDDPLPLRPIILEGAEWRAPRGLTAAVSGKVGEPRKSQRVHKVVD